MIKDQWRTQGFLWKRGAQASNPKFCPSPKRLQEILKNGPDNKEAFVRFIDHSYYLLKRGSCRITLLFCFLSICSGCRISGIETTDHQFFPSQIVLKAFCRMKSEIFCWLEYRKKFFSNLMDGIVVSLTCRAFHGPLPFEGKKESLSILYKFAINLMKTLRTYEIEVYIWLKYELFHPYQTKVYLLTKVKIKITLLVHVKYIQTQETCTDFHCQWPSKDHLHPDLSSDTIYFWVCIGKRHSGVKMVKNKICSYSVLRRM